MVTYLFYAYFNFQTVSHRKCQQTSTILSPGWSLPSLAAAPLGLTKVTKMPGSSPTCMLSTPPRMVNPSPVRCRRLSSCRVKLRYYSRPTYALLLQGNRLCSSHATKRSGAWWALQFFVRMRSRYRFSAFPRRYCLFLSCEFVTRSCSWLRGKQVVRGVICLSFL